MRLRVPPVPSTWRMSASSIAAVAKTPAVAKIEGEGGLAVTLKLRKQGADYWLSVAATGDGDSKASAEEITRRTQGWEYKIPASKAEAILKRRADLTEFELRFLSGRHDRHSLQEAPVVAPAGQQD